jgi:hypothetical protein
MLAEAVAVQVVKLEMLLQLELAVQVVEALEHQEEMVVVLH